MHAFTADGACIWLQVRRALLEADVSLPVVRRFIKKVEERALGMQVGGRGTRIHHPPYNREPSPCIKVSRPRFPGSHACMHVLAAAMPWLPCLAVSHKRTAHHLHACMVRVHLARPYRTVPHCTAGAGRRVALHSVHQGRVQRAGGPHGHSGQQGEAGIRPGRAAVQRYSCTAVLQNTCTALGGQRAAAVVLPAVHPTDHQQRGCDQAPRNEQGSAAVQLASASVELPCHLTDCGTDHGGSSSLAAG